MALKSYKDLRRIRILRGGAASQRRYCVTKWIAWRTIDIVLNQWTDQIAAQHQYLSADTKKELAGLLEITDVISVRLKSHEVTIELAEAYDWDDVEREILTVLREAFFPGDDYQKVEIQDRTKPAPLSVKTPALSRMADGGKRSSD